MNHNRTAAGHPAAFVIILIWGAAFISIKVLLRTFNSAEILFIQLVMEYLALWLACPRSLCLIPTRQEGLYVVMGFCSVATYYPLENIALACTLASNMNVIIPIIPFSIAISGWTLLKGERPRFRFFAGFLLATAGISLISFGDGAVLSLNPTGDLLAVAAAVIWAVYSTLTKKINALGYGTVQSARRTFFHGTLFMVPALAFTDFYVILAQFTDVKSILSPLPLGLGASVLCFVTWSTDVEIPGPVKISIYIYITPVITTLTSALILEEPVTVPVALGTIMTLAELFLSEQKTTKKGEPKIWATKMKSV